MATPNLVTECTAKCVFPYSDERGYRIEDHLFEDNSSQSIQISSSQMGEIDVKYETQLDSQKASFLAFFIAQSVTNFPTNKGAFYWNDPRTGEVDIKVKFKDKKVRFQADGALVWSWGVTLIRVL